MKESDVVLRARRFLKDVGVNSVPVDIELLVDAAGATLKTSVDMCDSESGQTFPLKGNTIIIVNGNHSSERQRFTVLHEIAHIVLNLPSRNHAAKLSNSQLLSYKGRPREEVLCDVFASECLLPFDQLGRDVAKSEISLESVKSLASRYEASLTSTGSRFAVCSNLACAFVLVENGRIRYVSSSQTLRELKGWIDINTAVPEGSVAQRVLIEDAQISEDYDEIASDVWFNNGNRVGEYVCEEAIVLSQWNQCLSLIWIEDNLKTHDFGRANTEDEEDQLLKELDGHLPWPSKRNRR